MQTFEIRLPRRSRRDTLQIITRSSRIPVDDPTMSGGRILPSARRRRSMMSDFLPVLAELTSNDQVILLILGLLISVPTIIAVVAIWTGAWTKVQKLRLENGLKQQ